VVGGAARAVRLAGMRRERVTSSSSWAFKFGLHRDVRGAWSCVRACVVRDERDKSVRWMPWRQEAMKDVARCDKLRGDASNR
jgi:hypothetical protein